MEAQAQSPISEKSYPAVMDMTLATPAMPLPLEQLLPLRKLSVTLCFLEDVHPGTHHYVPLTGFIKNLLQIDEVQLSRFSQHFCLRPPSQPTVRYDAGDYYSFDIVVLPGDEEMFERLFLRLQQLPHSIGRTDQELHFRDNVVLVSIRDGFSDSGDKIQHPDECSVWRVQDVINEALSLQSSAELTLDWLTPARLKLVDQESTDFTFNVTKQYGQSQPGVAKDYCRSNDTFSSELLLSKVYGSLFSLLRNRCEALPNRGLLPRLQSDQVNLNWQDVSYTTPQGKRKKAGGVCGSLRLTGLDDLPFNWWCLLVLGQHLGIGERRVFGMGHYQLNRGLE